MKGFLINVFDRTPMYSTGVYYPVPVLYKGYSHPDPPTVRPFCYGDHPENKTGLKSLVVGDILIFHTTLVYEDVAQRYIIGALKVGKINLVKDLSSKDKKMYSIINPHVKHNDLEATLYYQCETIFPAKARESANVLLLRPPLLFDKTLADELGLNVKWRADLTPYQQIAFATRAVRKINDRGIALIKSKVRRLQNEKEKENGKGKRS